MQRVVTSAIQTGSAARILGVQKIQQVNYHKKVFLGN